MDRSGPTPIRVFESGAILLHLAEKFGAFLPSGGQARAECLSWLFWQMGSAPFLGGGFGHFYAYAPTKIEYAIDRYAMEVKRQLDVLDRRLADNEYLAGSDYTIADMAVWPWYGALAKGLVYGAGEFLSVHEYKNVQRWTDAIAKRPAVKRGRMVNRISGDPASQLHERHDASDFETRTQDKIGERPGPTAPTDEQHRHAGEKPPWDDLSKRAPFASTYAGGRCPAIPLLSDRRRRIELDHIGHHRQLARPSTRSRSSRTSTAASPPTCATPMPVSPPARSRSSAPGIPTPTTISV